MPSAERPDPPVLSHDVWSGPFAGLRVVELSTGIACAYAGKLFADYGGDVVVVRTSVLDDVADVPSRSLAESLYLDTNKSWLELPERDPWAALREAVDGCDLFLSSVPPGLLAQHGLDYDTLARVHPSLVMLSLTPFGDSGPYAEWAATDLVLQAMSGWNNCGGEADREPLRTGGNVTQYVGGVWGAAAAAGAVYRAMVSGVGDYVEVSVLDAVTYCVGHEVTRLSYYGVENTYRRDGDPMPRAVLRTRDGYVGLSMLTDSHFDRWCRWLGREDLITDPRYSTFYAREDNADDLTELAREWAAAFTTDRIVVEGQSRGIPVVPVPHVDEIVRMSQHQARSYLVEVEDPDYGSYVMPGPPFRMSGSPWELRTLAPRRRGNDWTAPPAR